MIIVDRHWIDENVDMSKPITVPSIILELFPKAIAPFYIIKIHWDQPQYPIANDRSKAVFPITIQDSTGEEYNHQLLNTFGVAQFEYFEE